MPAADYSRYTAVQLHDGQVLAESFNAETGERVARASIYNPETNSWTQTSSMNLTNGYGSPVVLNNGNVLFSGGLVGVENAPSSSSTTAASQIYDPTTNRWTPVAPMLQDRSLQTATLLADGSVLVVGGVEINTGPLFEYPGDAERHDPNTNTWTKVSAGFTSREDSSVVHLPDGRIMVIGGAKQGETLATAELFNPTTNNWYSAAPMTTPRSDASATILPDGRVLMAGGRDNESTDQPLASTEIYDPVTNSWSDGPPMTTAREDQAAVLLPSGEVLVVGGVGPEQSENGNLALASTEIYDPTTNSWSNGPDMPAAIGYPSAVPLAEGSIQALVLGATNLHGARGRGLLYTTHVPGPTERQLPPGGPLLANRVYFPQTGHYLADGFLAYWQDFGGLPIFGYPISEEFQLNGLTVQYFERALFEWHPGSNPARYDVELALLGHQPAAARGLLSTKPFQPVEAAGDANCTFDAVTKHRLCFGFRDYWQAHGGLAIFGHPISEEFQDPVTGLMVQ
ncbi:MAG TPA: kelch repeat-containing protein, partial [Thermomicrobiaceae bacterium]|nr:kelch repeat-containing protein [Thermomicrobiaceae bacterium]